jgi:hypothetical protein
VNKKKVICDTNIWYEVSLNKLNLNKKEYCYLATSTNIMDFISSDKVNGTFKEQQALRMAILTMDSLADEILFHDPTTEAKKLLYNVEIDNTEIMQSKANYAELLRYANQEVGGIYGPGLDSLITTKKNFQHFTISFKKQLDSIFGKTKNYNTIQKQIIKGNIAKWLHENFNNDGVLNNSTDVNFNNVSVFINAFCEYLEDVKTQNKPNKNSMVDFFQLLYLGDKQKLFWTTEPRINNKISKGHTSEDEHNIIYEKHLNPKQ